MAISLVQFPEDHAPAYNPIWWVFSSTLTAQPNFEYFLDVFITGATFAGGATFLRLKAPADPVYGRGIFNIADILQRQLTSDLGDTSAYGFQQCANSILGYTVRYGEMYGASSAVTAVIGATSAEYYAFNGSLGALEWKDYATNEYRTIGVGNNVNVNLLTNQPSSGSVIRASEDQWIYVMQGDSGSCKFANVNLYTQNYGDKIFVHGYRVINHIYFTPDTTVSHRYLRFPAGYNLASIPAGSIYSYLGTPVTHIPVESDGVTIWEIYFSDHNHERVTESFWVIKDTICSTHTEYRLHFKNKWGAFDSFTFTKESQITTDVSRSQYEKPMGEFKSASSYTYAKTDRFQTSFYTWYKPTIKLNSDWITEEKSTWLEELLTSPEIYLDDATHGMIPINIIDTKYTRRKHKSDKIFNLSIEFQYTFGETRQGA